MPGPGQPPRGAAPQGQLGPSLSYGAAAELGLLGSRRGPRPQPEAGDGMSPAGRRPRLPGWAPSPSCRAGPAPAVGEAAGAAAFFRSPAVPYLISWGKDRPLMAAVLWHPGFQPV